MSFMSSVLLSLCCSSIPTLGHGDCSTVSLLKTSLDTDSTCTNYDFEGVGLGGSSLGILCLGVFGQLISATLLAQVLWKLHPFLHKKLSHLLIRTQFFPSISMQYLHLSFNFLKKVWFPLHPTPFGQSHLYLHNHPVMSSIIFVFFSFKYFFVYMGTSLSMCEGALSHCKVYRSLYMGTSSMFLDLGLMYFFFLLS